MPWIEFEEPRGEYDVGDRADVPRRAAQAIVLTGGASYVDGPAPSTQSTQPKQPADMTRDELLALGNDRYELDMPGNISRSDALELVQDAQAEYNH